MVRRLSVVGLAAALLTVAVGCRSSCSSGSGLFTSSGNGSNCRLVGSGKPTPIYYESTPGVPVSGPVGSAPGMVVPGYGQPAPRADELPYPQPNGMIPPAGVPFAPPVPAPGDMSGTSGAGKTVPVRTRN